MLLIERLLALQGPLVGTGVNHEGEHFTGRLEVVSLVAGQAALLHDHSAGQRRGVGALCPRLGHAGARLR